MTINLEELRQIVSVLLDSLEENTNSIAIDADHYWDVPEKARYDNYDTPTELSIGQLTDDWNELQRIGRGETPALPYALVWLSTLLRRIGEQVPPASSQK